MLRNLPAKLKKKRKIKNNTLPYILMSGGWREYLHPSFCVKKGLEKKGNF